MTKKTSAPPPVTFLELAPGLSIDLAAPSVVQDGLRFWVTGESGSGKSNASMLIAAKWLELGRQLVVLDSHGEYENLWQMRPRDVYRIGYGDKPLTAHSVQWVMSLIRDGYSVLLDLSHWADIDHKVLDAFVRELMLDLYAYRRTKPGKTLVLIEEAHNYAPQMQSAGQNDNIKTFVGMLTGGRKYGLNFIVSSQAQSMVEVTVVNACNVRIFMRVSDVSNWKRIKPYLPEKFPINFGSKTKKDIKQFESGEAVVLTRWFDAKRVQLNLAPVAVKKFIEVEDE